MEKLEITPIDANNKPVVNGTIIVQFNPTQYAVTKPVEWAPQNGHRNRDAPLLEFKRGKSRSMTLELFFDVSEPIEDQGAFLILDDVRELTSPLVALTRGVRKGKQLLAPQMIRLDWGGAGPRHSDFPFIGVVNNLVQTFTLFSPQGQPLRATVSLGITESSDPRQDPLLQASQSPSLVASRGKNLQEIAAAVYGDPRAWRSIATVNGIDDPLKVDAELGKAGSGGLLLIPQDDKS